MTIKRPRRDIYLKMEGGGRGDTVPRKNIQKYTRKLKDFPPISSNLPTRLPVCSNTDRRVENTCSPKARMRTGGLEVERWAKWRQRAEGGAEETRRMGRCPPRPASEQAFHPGKTWDLCRGWIKVEVRERSPKAMSGRACCPWGGRASQVFPVFHSIFIICYNVKFHQL